MYQAAPSALRLIHFTPVVAGAPRVCRPPQKRHLHPVGIDGGLQMLILVKP
jgi:hypothetical protein